MIRDAQKSKVYGWEATYLASLDTRVVPFDNIESIVKYVWASEGLLYPPLVRELSANATKVLGKGSRDEVRFVAEGVTTRVILHELAHAMNDQILSAESHEDNDRHGPNFVGIYMKLLAKYLKIDLLVLTGTAMKAGVKFNINARPLMA